MLKVGDRAPEFTAITDEGKTVSLRDFRGRKVVLYFYPRDDTPGCTKEACAFRDHYRAIQDRGAVVLGVSTDTAASHARFKEKHGLPFPLLADPERKIVRAYGVWVRKSRYGRTSMGTARTTFIIDERGVITRIFPQVRVDGHVEEVLEALTGQATRP
ncbi:MAG: thioredoxin-dependent thiol peroxidase [Armatimonadota bacterium]|nr:thioredoxin-dependent thiol peroxidase [Armatimonadota bacterium]MDR7518952.1 thioredoxin-dependent thiol peroxidase [Armatimonadota bacterium]MDR7548577.1 thioredoxin-dependent thiol peroxidase [Armatimonadota bacterium]